MLFLALTSTVALLVWMGFFMMGSLPLLILKHDTPVDARFIRGLFNLYYLALIITAAAAGLSYLAIGRPAVAAALGALALLGIGARRWFVGGMDRLRSTMTADDAAGIRRFRRLHVGGMALNVVLLAIVCVGLTKGA